MHEAVRRGRLEGAGDLAQQRHRLVRLQRSGRQQVGEGARPAERAHQADAVVHGVRADQGQHVRVLDRGARACQLHDMAAQLGVADDRRVEEGDGHPVPVRGHGFHDGVDAEAGGEHALDPVAVDGGGLHQRPPPGDGSGLGAGAGDGAGSGEGASGGSGVLWTGGGVSGGELSGWGSAGGV
jgi:hypothetical protein